MSDDPLFTDDQLSAELDRRANGSTVPDDWARAHLLPAVRNAIDTRPQPVPASRWAPLAGLAGIAAAILLLVVAVPRLVPGEGPTSIPSAPESIAVLQSAEFAGQLASGSLRGHTLLVAGRIDAYDGPELYGANCAVERTHVQAEQPSYTCIVGRLAGVASPVYVDAPYVADLVDLSSDTDLNSFAFAYVWRAPEPPLEGTLVVSVDQVDRVTLLGIAPAGEITSNLAEIRSRDASTAGLNDAYVVPAWLAGIDIRECPISASPAHGLPGRSCDPSWLTADESGSRAASLTVQDLAYFSFGIDSDARRPRPPFAGEPSRGLYLVARRLEAAGCPANEVPCWQWEVIGRLGDSDTAPSPAPSDAIATPVTAPPDPTPSPEPPSTGSLNCSPGGWPSPTADILLDNTDTVTGCASQLGYGPAPDSLTVSNPGGDARRIQVTWPVSSCDVRPLALEFWRRPDGPASSDANRPHYVLRVDRSTTITSCVDGLREITTQTLWLTLSADVEAADVVAFFTYGDLGVDTTHTDAADFQLELTTTQNTVPAGEPIDVTASGTWTGAEAALTVTGYGAWFGFEQLDGPLAMYPIWTMNCPRPQTLRAGQEESWLFSKSGGWSNDDPNAAFYRRYLEDPELLLPAGDYRIFVMQHFSLGSTCSADPTRLESSIIVHVR